MATAPSIIPPRVGALGHRLTTEQDEIISRPPDRTRKWIAYAGCGKTSTAIEYAHAHPETALYMAFNASIAADAKGRFPNNVRTQTANSYAYSAMNAREHSDRMVGRFRPEHLDRLELQQVGNMTDLALRRAVIKSVNAFLISGDDRVEERHMQGFPYSVRSRCLPMVRKAVDQMLDFEGSGMPFTHDVYLKAFAMRGRISDMFDYLILDEAQDWNPVLIQIAKKANRPAQIVGDPHQCLPPGECIATPHGDVEIESISEGDFVLAGCGQGGIAPARITKVRTFHANSLTTITTKGGRRIRSTPNHCHFAGFHGEGGETGWCIYLMYRSDLGYRIGVANDYKDPKQGLKLGWMMRANQESADRAYVLSQRMSYEDARLQETMLSLKYGIPTAVFQNRGQSSLGQEYTKRLFAAVDSVSGGKRLLSDMGLAIDYPHYRPKGMRSDRLNFSITLCGDRGRHRHSVSGTDAFHRNLLESAGIITRASKFGGWRNEGSRKSLDHAYALYQQIKATAPHVNLIEKAALAAGRSLPVVPASNCLPGMTIFVRDRATGTIVFDEIDSVSTEAYDGPVYDLDVENYHNYIANDVVTHNSIYLFRGAVQAMDAFKGEILTLSQSFRFGPEIAAVANFILKKSLSPPDNPLVGNPAKTSRVREYTGITNGRATILSRTNLRLFEGLVRIPRTFHVVGGADDMINQVESGYQLWLNRNDSSFRPKGRLDPLVARHKTWDDLVESSELDEEPETIRLVKIIDTFTTRLPEILQDLRSRSRAREQDADFVVSTAHKAKGREWPNVIVLDDFQTPFALARALSKGRLEKHEYDQEINLLYVTLTRAIETLSISTELYDEIASGIGIPR